MLLIYHIGRLFLLLYCIVYHFLNQNALNFM